MFGRIFENKDPYVLRGDRNCRRQESTAIRHLNSRRLFNIFMQGTPGRIHDMMKREFLRTDKLKLLIMDEADNMLGRGFED
jgi:hypothetical protein